MIKKALIGGSVGLLAMGLLFGRNAVHFATTSVGWVQHTIDDKVPVELKIEQARGMIQQMEPEVRRNKHLIVREEVELERLADQIAKIEAKQSTEEANLMRMREGLCQARENGAQYISFSGRRYSMKRVERDAAHRLERYKTNSDTVENLRRQLDVRQQRLAAARTEVEQMLAARNQLVADVEKLEARQKMTTVAQTSSEFDLDTSVLARANELVRDIETRLDVTERLLDVDLQFVEQIQLDEPSVDDVSAKIADYFGVDQPGVETIAEISSVPQL